MAADSAGAFRHALLGASIVIGSGNLADFDSALVGYTFVCLFATFESFTATVWLVVAADPHVLAARVPGVLLSRMRWRRLVVQASSWARCGRRSWPRTSSCGAGGVRWAAHMLIAYCVLLPRVTFPLVFGWLHPRAGRAISPTRATMIFFNLRVVEIPLGGGLAWFISAAFVVSAFMVISGVMLAMGRMREGGAPQSSASAATSPLILLFAVSITGPCCG